MSSTTDFTAAEWNLLKELPFKVILAAVVADVRGPAGAARDEIAQGAHELVSSATSEYSDNGLIMSVLSDVANDPATEEEISLDDEEARRAAVVEAIALSEQAQSLLSNQEEQDEATAYREWIYAAAAAATKATKSGGIMRFRMGKVSPNEKHFLDYLSEALGLPPREPEEENPGE